jgi:hypothetical protein
LGPAISPPIAWWRNARQAGIVRELTGSHSLEPLENGRRMRHQGAKEEHQRGDAAWGMRWKEFAFST